MMTMLKTYFLEIGVSSKTILKIRIQTEKFQPYTLDDEDDLDDLSLVDDLADEWEDQDRVQDLRKLAPKHSSTRIIDF